MDKKKIGKILYNLIPAAAVLAMLIFGGLYLRDYLQYREADAEYDRLSEAFSITADEAEAAGDASEDGKGEVSKDDPEYYPVLNVDYDALHEINKDFACVLYIPAIELSYPVVYSSDNTDYLKKTFEGKSNFAGSIFYDCLSPHDFRGRNTFIFGHNMKNGSMFGTLKLFEKDTSLCGTDPYIYIYTDRFVRKYRIFSYYKTLDGSASYDDINGSSGYDKYIELCLTKSDPGTEENGIDFVKRPQLLTLSTCTGRSGGNQRFVVHAALINTIKTD